MELRELLNCSMAPFEKGSFYKLDELWKCTLFFQDGKGTDMYVLDSNYPNDENYLLKYRHRQITWWDIPGTGKDLIIEIEGEM